MLETHVSFVAPDLTIMESATTTKPALSYKAVKALSEVADWLESTGIRSLYYKGAVGFEMKNYQRDGFCGTVCCIAGAVCLFNGIDDDYHSMGYEAMRFLGIAKEDAEALFMPKDPYFRSNEITKDWAARVIRKYIATGVVDWQGCK